MSQHNYTLLLFLKDKEHQQQCFEMFRCLDTLNVTAAQDIASKLDIDPPMEWKTKWFDTSIKNEQDCLILDFETSQYIQPPLPLIRELFRIGLKGAVLEVFNDSVCEFCHGYFIEDRAVNRDELLNDLPEAREFMATKFGADYFDLQNGLSEGDITLKELVKIYAD